MLNFEKIGFYFYSKQSCTISLKKPSDNAHLQNKFICLLK